MKYAWLLLGCVGCFPMQEREQTPLVSGNFAGPSAPTGVAQTNYAPASTETATRVDMLGRKILADNPQTGVKPLFATIGSPQAEVFHADTRLVYVTEGLVKSCRTEGELAAVLCLELGKMVAEREATVSAEAREPRRQPPMETPIGNAGQFNNSDMVRLAELGRFEKEHPRVTGELPRPDPKNLAKIYLEKAGFPRSDFDAACPIIQTAEQNYALERTMKGAVTPAVWHP